MKIHPIAEKFPLMSSNELEELAYDILQNGQAYPILTWNDIIIDGRNRLSACQKAGVEPRFEIKEFVDEYSAICFIISSNVKRRHLTVGQLSMLARDLAPEIEMAANKRKIEGNKKGGMQPRVGGVSSRSRGNSINRDNDANRVLGKIFGIGHASVGRAKTITTRAPDLAEKVRSDELSLDAAYKQVMSASSVQAKPRQSVDIAKLTETDKQKLEIAISQEKRRLSFEFQTSVNNEVQKILDETVLPGYNEELARYRQIIEARKGILPRATFRSILACLHPDRVPDPALKDRYTAAFDALKKAELLIVAEKEMPTSPAAFPRTASEAWAAMRKTKRA